MSTAARHWGRNRADGQTARDRRVRRKAARTDRAVRPGSNRGGPRHRGIGLRRERSSGPRLRSVRLALAPACAARKLRSGQAMTAFFVTATGTDIGKTFVTAGLVRWLRGQGVGGAAIKPVVSGLAPGALAASDCAVLLAAMGEAITPEAAARISPWQFTAPLSPDMAGPRAS